MNMRLHTYMLKQNADTHDVNIYRPISTFFSFSPDVFCLLPKHQLRLVGRKVNRWANVYAHTRSKLIRSMCYGILIHFACDFATAPHNFLKELDLMKVHQEYEMKLTKYRLEMNNMQEIIQNISDYMWNKYNNMDLLDAITEINGLYLEANEKNVHSENPVNIETIKIDYLYASVLCDFTVRYLIRIRDTQNAISYQGLINADIV